MRWWVLVFVLVASAAVWTVGSEADERARRSRSRLDSTFGRDGVVALRVPSQRHPRRTILSRSWQLRDAVADESGRVYVLSGGLGAASSVLTAYDAEGRLDREFGSDGALGLGVLGVFRSMTVDTSGRVVVVGRPEVAEEDRPGGFLRVDSGVLVLRILPDGRLDPSFGHGGVQRPTTNLIPLDVARDAAGRLTVLTGSIDLGEVVMMRLSADGELDEAYGQEGLRILPQGPFPGIRSLEAFAVDANGRVAALFAARIDGAPRFLLVRLDATGRPDGAVGEGGVLPLDFGADADMVSDIGIDATGRCVILGGGASPFIARVSLDGTPDATWSGTPAGVRDILPSGAAANTQPWSLTIDGDVYYAATAHGFLPSDNRGPAVVVRVDADSERVWRSRSRRFKSGLEVLSARDDTVLAVGVERRRRDPDQDATSLVRVRFD